MAERIFVKPAAAETLVRLPTTKKHVPADGCWVEKTSFIVRRIQEGSLVESQPAPVAKKPAAPAAPAQKEGDK